MNQSMNESINQPVPPDPNAFVEDVLRNTSNMQDKCKVHIHIYTHAHIYTCTHTHTLTQPVSRFSLLDPMVPSSDIGLRM